MTLLAFILLNNQLQRMRDQADSFGNAIATQLAHTAREPLLAEDRFLLKVHINNLVRSDSIAGAALFNRGGPADRSGRGATAGQRPVLHGSAPLGRARGKRHEHLLRAGARQR